MDNRTPDSIVFFGSGPVAAKSLDYLAENFTVEAVITKPRSAHHHGAVPVLETAERLSLPVFTVTDKQSLNELFASQPVKSDLAVLIDFGIIISQATIDYFPLGIINSHFSILPDLRGADPISFAILSGQDTTGVSLMLLVEAMDEGPLLGYGEHALDGAETTPQLTENLIDLSNALLHDLLPKYRHDQMVMPQTITNRAVSYSRKLTKADGLIDWHQPALKLEREIRAFIEWPKSRTQLAGKDVVITKATVINRHGAAGTVLIEDKLLVVLCGEQALQIDNLKPAGKAEMTAAAFLAGYGNLL